MAEKHKINCTVYHKGEFVDVRMELAIDWARFTEHFAEKVVRSKTGRAQILGGAIKIKRMGGSK
jgi:hypothetical protein